MKDELGEDVMTFRLKTYSYLMDDGQNDQKIKRNKEMYNKMKT